MALIKYDKQDQKKKDAPTDYIPSGIQSGDSDAEMMILVPIKSHPELVDVVRAIDPDTGWKGWVEYKKPVEPTPEPTPKPEPTQGDRDSKELGKLTREIEEANELVSLGILDENDPSITTKKARARTLYDSLNS